MRHLLHSDANTKAIVKALRDAGANVEYLIAPMGRRGVPDLLVGVNGTSFLLEVKTLGAKGKKGKLDDDQIAWHASWRGGPLVTVYDVAGALAAVGIEPA